MGNCVSNRHEEELSISQLSPRDKNTAESSSSRVLTLADLAEGSVDEYAAKDSSGRKRSELEDAAGVLPPAHTVVFRCPM